MESVAQLLSDYLRAVAEDTGHPATLELDRLPAEFRSFGAELSSFCQDVLETKQFARMLAKGNLDQALPDLSNQVAAPLKSLHAALRHLTWQSQQVAKGDYQQRIDFMGEFSVAFNAMTEQLEHQRAAMLDKIENCQTEIHSLTQHTELERERRRQLEDVANYDALTQAFNRRYGVELLEQWLREKREFILCFVDIDNLKYVNDRFGHTEGDCYILRIVALLREFSSKSVVCRIGGDEFMLLAEGFTLEQATARFEEIRSRLLAHKQDTPQVSYENGMSYGIVSVEADNTFDSSALLYEADDRMYQYKRACKAARRAARFTRT